MKKQKKNLEENKTITHEVVQGEYGKFVSEVQDFKKPENYDDAFSKYYPKGPENLF
ncbi:hypothetical protein SAMN02745163_00998 [Clostridium cavendishii DSM 21758]|uniref:Uncharacterized protein n=1 Tax=Clostridium cavendishii DSM 21758 TaxID=1121302 RepID=A0A1M6EZZ4_9CLOT|nr:hypothetical protein [Clostridium cavendishii]SHI91007.1 hypothetical protein SAMN02745163_00998 [Clostridium cavendishii DSM 21758]